MIRLQSEFYTWCLNFPYRFQNDNCARLRTIRSRLENYEVTTVRVNLECFQSLNREKKKRRALQYVHAREGIQTNSLGGTTPYSAAFRLASKRVKRAGSIGGWLKVALYSVV